jgi:hypothetical protein
MSSSSSASSTAQPISAPPPSHWNAQSSLLEIIQRRLQEPSLDAEEKQDLESILPHLRKSTTVHMWVTSIRSILIARPQIDASAIAAVDEQLNKYGLLSSSSGIWNSALVVHEFI